MNNNGNGGFWTSWPVIILALFFFWPVGLFLLLRKFSVDKKAAISAGGKGMKAIGIVLIVFAAVGFLGFVTSFAEYGFSSGDVGGIIVLLFFAAGGVALLRKAKKIKKEAKSIKEYLSIIVNGNVRQLDSIAATTGKSYDTVYKDVKNMIDKGYLKNAYINESTREVVLPSAAPVAPQNTATIATVNAAPVQTKIVVCPCCGANNTVVGDTGECEYCGSPLK